ncbi:MAG: urease accessory protein UreD [Xanthobacteraceae bacterium]
MSDVSATNTQQSSEVFAANRATGRILLTVIAVSGKSRRGRVHEAGSLRIRFPHSAGDGIEAAIINTAGGMTGGDQFDLDFKVESGAALRVTTAAAEKVYRSLGPDTTTDVRFDVNSGGSLVWLPQETILFDRARFRRNIEINLAGDARLLLAEACVFGRSAMGETVADGRFFDRWLLRVDGSLRFADSIRLDGAIARQLAERAIAAGNIAVASLVKYPGNEKDVESVRALQQDFGGEVGISAWNGLVVARCVAANGALLRCDLVRVLTALNATSLPRLWLN